MLLGTDGSIKGRGPLRWLNPSRGMSARGAWECVWAHAVHISGYIPGFGTPPGHMKRLNGVPATGPALTALLARQVPLGDMARGWRGEGRQAGLRPHSAPRPMAGTPARTPGPGTRS